MIIVVLVRRVIMAIVSTVLIVTIWSYGTWARIAQIAGIQGMRSFLLRNNYFTLRESTAIQQRIVCCTMFDLLVHFDFGSWEDKAVPGR